ncbi:ester cyclase [Kitasatospora sp. NPDC058170]|uniref:ester cyclase n=1 Tax=Kitasatospora sp. NPDC058170 TaxID=3346364 RepID=UPI0036DCC842
MDSAITTPKDLVHGFMLQVRSGAHPERAELFMADRVLAHQQQAENRYSVERTPGQYAEHVREMRAAYGEFALTVEEILADGDRVYVRWVQDGHHLAEVDGHPPTGAPLREIASAVYRVADGRIVEYWIQIDRHGLTAQLRQPATE